MSHRKLYDRVSGIEQSIGEKTSLADARYLFTRKFSGAASDDADVVEDVLLHDGSDNRDIDGREIQLQRAADFTDDGDAFEVEFKALLVIDANTDFQQQDWPSPLLPAEIGQQGEPSELERLLVQVFERGHLDTIATRPQLNIRYDAERQPIERAKRLDPAFLRDLAAHSECWASRTLSGVIPNTILAQISEDELDIYEHRVFARLLDHLERYLRRRIRTLEKISKSFANALDFENAEDVDYRLRNDICAVWGEAVADSDMDSSGLLEQNQARLERLRRWERHLRRLKSGDLYRAIPRNASVGLNLRSTNLLQHDPHYRQLRLLWLAWLKVTASERWLPEQVLEKRQSDQARYERYIGVLIYRALRLLDFAIALDSDENGRAVNDNWGEDLAIRYQRHEWHVIQRDRRIVLVPAAIAVDSSNQSQWRTHQDDDNALRIPCLLQADAQNVAFAPSACLRDDQPPLVLSPLELYTEEILVSVLSAWLWMQRIEGYKSAIPRLPKAVLDAWPKHAATSGHEGMLDVPVSAKEWQPLKDALREYANAEARTQVEQRKLQLDRLNRCPECGQPAGTFSSTSKGFFARCDCGCKWGISENGFYRHLGSEAGTEFKSLGRRWIG